MGSVVNCKEFQHELVSEIDNDQENYSYCVAKTVGMMDGSEATVWNAFFDHATNELYVQVPTQYTQFSKETVTAFLDMLEGSGGCVNMCIANVSQDLAVLAKNFTYMGFHEAPSRTDAKAKYTVLCYSMNDD